MCCLEGLQHINTIHKHVFMYCIYSIGAVLVVFFFFGLILMSNTCAKEKEKKEKKPQTRQSNALPRRVLIRKQIKTAVWVDSGIIPGRYLLRKK